jgi:L-galactose dehydrogenase/L-glyceraldehyde 3-phosphate reductase
MEQRALGSTGLEVSALGFGCGAVGGLMVRGDPKERVRSVARALDAGINYYDTAPSYGDGASEENLGQALRELGVRNQVLVGTKVRLDPAQLAAPVPAVRRSLEQSLARLGLDSVDLVHFHNPISTETITPSGSGVPVEVALEGVAEGLTRLVEDGLARHVGFTAVGATDAIKRLAATPTYETAQAYLNVLNPSGIRPGASGGQQDFEGFITEAGRQGTGIIAIRVYAAGALAGGAERHPNAYLPQQPLIPGSEYGADVERARRLERFAADTGMESVLELGLRFALTAPGVSTVLVGLSTYEHLDTAITWAERGPLPDEQFENLIDIAAS